MKSVCSLLVSFCIGFVLGQGILMHYESKTFKPWGWKEAPVVMNCYGEELNILYIQDALNFWNLKGHTVAFVEQNPPAHLCKKDFIAGFIILKKTRRGELNSGTLAVTFRKRDGIYLSAATIKIKSGCYRLSNLLEHEFGHAFGYTHAKYEGHIMHPDYNKIGTKFWIPD